MKIIAETASNHMGDLNSLMKMTDLSFKNKADFVTFQMFCLDDFLTKGYTNYELFKNLEMKRASWEKFIEYCIKNDFQIIPCPLDYSSFEICENYNLKNIKIHACDALNINFIKNISEKSDKVFLEVGGLKKDEILKVKNEVNSKSLICIYGYNDRPVIENQNIQKVRYLKELLEVPIGFADHSQDISTMPILALFEGAEYYEKHISIDKNDKTRLDNEVSINVEDLNIIKQKINIFSKMKNKNPFELNRNEQNYRNRLFKRPVYNSNLPEGSIIKDNNIQYKRTNDNNYIHIDRNHITGKTLNKNVKKDNIIKLEDFYND